MQVCYNSYKHDSSSQDTHKLTDAFTTLVCDDDTSSEMCQFSCSTGRYINELTNLYRCVCDFFNSCTSR